MAKKLKVKQWAVKFTDSPQKFDKEKYRQIIRLYHTKAGADAVVRIVWEPQEIPAKTVSVTVVEN